MACLFVVCRCGLFIGSLPWANGSRPSKLEGGRDSASDTFCARQSGFENFTLNTAFQIICQTLFVPKTASETTSAPPLSETGYGTRRYEGGFVGGYIEGEGRAQMRAERGGQAVHVGPIPATHQ